jgi:hypothetical protein
MKLAWRVVGLIVGAVFVYAGLAKIIALQPFRLSNPTEFARDIDNYKMLPWSLALLLGLYLPWLEILCGLALMMRILYRGGVIILTALMAMFIVATLVAKARGLDISCGCFGHVGKDLSFAWHLALDFVLLGGLMALCWPGLHYADSRAE